MTSQEVCISCRRPKAHLSCEVCFEPVCKECEQFLEASTFSFLSQLPEDLSHTHYCPYCYDSKVAPALEEYQAVMERARDLPFFFVTQRKAIPLIKQSKDSIRVESCDDRNETILRLAFLAVEQGYNAVIEADVTADKIRNSGYQKSRWRGVAIPAHIDAEKLARWSPDR
jgi:hypothetical protein